MDYGNFFAGEDDGDAGLEGESICIEGWGE